MACGLRVLVRDLRRVSAGGDHRRRGKDTPHPREAGEGPKPPHGPRETGRAFHLRGPGSHGRLGVLPATSNAVESTNAQFRHMLREHRRLSLERRIKAVCWWRYMHTECPMDAAEILKAMPTDEDVTGEMRQTSYENEASPGPQRWGADLCGKSSTSRRRGGGIGTSQQHVLSYNPNDEKPPQATFSQLSTIAPRQQDRCRGATLKPV
jgi:hypothetical protein